MLVTFEPLLRFYFYKRLDRSELKGIPGLNLIMPERHLHFHSEVAARLQDHPVACTQLRKESEIVARALLK